MRATLLGRTQGSGSAFIGQSYRLNKDSTFSAGSGLADHLSDIVGRVEAQPSPLLDLLYRFRIDRENFKIRRQELGAAVGPPAVRLSLNYLFIDRQADQPEFTAREEVRAGIQAQVTPHWRLGANMVRNLGDPGGELSHGFNLTYEDECFIISGNYSRNFSFDRDLRPTTTVFFRVVFKNLGQVQL